MKRIAFVSLSLLAALIACQGNAPLNNSSSSNSSSSNAGFKNSPRLQTQAVETRDYLKWPFPASSIWNMPLHNNAQYVNAPIQPSSQYGLAPDENLLILRPTAPLKTVYVTTAGWDFAKTRCGSIDFSKQAFNGVQVPIPNDFRTDPGYVGVTPNQSAAILMPDGVTVKQSQPMHICGFGGTVVAGGDANGAWQYPDDNLKTGDGILGAHGGPRMSSIGGTIRVGELRPGTNFRHALTLQLDGRYLTKNNNDGTKGYRWPATAADANVDTYYTGTNPQMEIGALMAISPTFNISAMRTEPARIMARALRDYGTYVVDTTGWDVYQFTYEWGPDGRFIDQFQSDWGFSINDASKPDCTETSSSCQFSKDMADLMTNIKVIANNAPSTIGGGPNSDITNRRAPPAPPFADGTGGTGGYSIFQSPATGNGDINNIKDGNTSTSWTSSALQSNALAIRLDLGAAQSFSSININAGGSNNYLRSYEVYASNDINAWGSWVTGGNASTGNLTLSFAAQNARYVTLRLAAANPGLSWTIAELQIGNITNASGSSITPPGALSRSAWTFIDVPTTGSGAIGNIKDDSLSTLWTSSANQSNAQALRIDLGSVQTFNRIIVDAGGSNNYLRSYEVYANNSTNAWGTWLGAGAASSGSAMITVPSTTARYIVLRLGTANPGVPWSIGELWVANQ